MVMSISVALYGHVSGLDDGPHRIAAVATGTPKKPRPLHGNDGHGPETYQKRRSSQSYRRLKRPAMVQDDEM